MPRDYVRIDAHERNAARDAGLTQYEGRPCPVNPSHGRRCYTATGGCVECARAANRARRQARALPPAAERDRMTKPATRAEALSRQTVYYHTGRPCRRGHTSDRYTATGACVECVKGAEIAPRKPKHPPDAAQRVADWFYYPLPRPLALQAFAFCQALDLARGADPFPYVDTCLRKPPAKERRHAPAHIAFHLCGWFRYPLQPGDHAAALAYCQSLDVQSGRIPYKP